MWLVRLLQWALGEGKATSESEDDQDLEDEEDDEDEEIF